MAPTYTSILRILKQETYSNPETWGEELNAGALDMLDEALSGVSVPVAGNVTLSSQNAISDQSRRLVLHATGAGGFNIVAPAISKPYFVINACVAAIVIKTSVTTGVTVRAGMIAMVYFDGTNWHVDDPTLDKIKPPTASVDMNGQKITGLADGTADTDAANVRTVGALIASSVADVPPQIGNGGKFLKTNGTDPLWDKVTLSDTDEIEGVLAVANGGTGLSVPGASGNLLVSDGAGFVSTPPSSPGLVPIGSLVTAASSAAMDLVLSGSYQEYVLKFWQLKPTNDGASLFLRTSTNGGSSFDSGATDYTWYMMYGLSSAASVAGSNNAGITEIYLNFSGIGNAANEDGISGEIRFFRPSAATHCNVCAETTYTSSSGALAMTKIVGRRNAAANVDAVRLFPSASTLASGFAQLYGVVTA